MSMKNTNDTIWYRTRDIPSCSSVPLPTAGTQIPKQEFQPTRSTLLAQSLCSLDTQLWEGLTARSICKGNHVTRPPVPSRYIIGVGQGSIIRLGWGMIHPPIRKIPVIPTDALRWKFTSLLAILSYVESHGTWTRQGPNGCTNSQPLLRAPTL
jgi:hypothetical protein